MENLPQVQQYFNEKGQLKKWPSRKQKAKQAVVMLFLANLFEQNRKYTEREVSEILNEKHTFGDAALLRRELFERGFLGRTLDGRSYWSKLSEK